MTKSRIFLAVCTLILGGVAVVLVLRIQSVRERLSANDSAVPQQESTPSHQSATPSPPSISNAFEKSDFSSHIKAVVDVDLDKVSEKLALATSLAAEKKNRDKFFLESDRGLASWSHMSEVYKDIDQRIKEEMGQNPESDALLRAAQQNVRLFWEEGGLSNAKTQQRIYTAQRLAEKAVEINPENENAYFTLENVLLSYALQSSPYADQEREEYSQSVFGILYSGKESLANTSVRHFYIIMKKNPVDITERDLAVVSRICMMHNFTSLITLTRDVPELKSRSTFQLSKTQALLMGMEEFEKAARKESLRLGKEIQLEAAEFGYRVSRAKGWTYYATKFNETVQALRAGEIPPYWSIYRSVVFRLDRNDVFNFYLFDRRYDGFEILLRGQPVFLPSSPTEDPSLAEDPGLNELFEDANRMSKGLMGQ